MRPGPPYTSKSMVCLLLFNGIKTEHSKYKIKQPFYETFLYHSMQYVVPLFKKYVRYTTYLTLRLIELMVAYSFLDQNSLELVGTI